jgi:hypothetical protein
LRFRCPVFYKYIICASGFNEETKKRIKTQVESGGGTYCGDLTFNETTHLVLNEPKGAKFEAAKMWKILVVKSEWINDSLAAGYCLPEKEYILQTVDNQTSTPTGDRVITKQKSNVPPEIDISCIGNAGRKSSQRTFKFSMHFYLMLYC